MSAVAKIDFNSRKTILIVSILFVVLNAIALRFEFYILALLPVAVLMALLVLYKPDIVILIIAFFTPISVNLEDLGMLGGIGIYLPTEPILFGLMVLYFLRLLIGHGESKALIRHPLSLALLFTLFWIAVTALTSTMPLVSLKFLIARLWFVTVMFYFANRFFRNEAFIRKFLTLYIIGMCAIIIYTVAMHASMGFSEEAGHWVMSPFFKDHTSYGAIIALFFPLVVYHFIRLPFDSIYKWFFAIALTIFSVGLVLSYTRAAWVSLVGAAGVLALIKLRISYKFVVAGVLLLGGLYIGFESQVTHYLSKNRQDSSGNLSEHIQSISNVSSDASNLERLNRWNSALRMFSEKPFFGHGPGTYMFNYATFQKSSDKTIISTNQGDGGNAHSEFLGPLSESGIIGALSMLALFIISLFTGIRLYYQLEPKSYLRGIALCIVLGLVTYYLHGILNNYLDTDKASVPIWAMMSILVAVQINHTSNNSYLKRQQSKAVSSK